MEIKGKIDYWINLAVDDLDSAEIMLKNTCNPVFTAIRRSRIY